MVLDNAIGVPKPVQAVSGRKHARADLGLAVVAPYNGSGSGITGARQREGDDGAVL